MCICFVCVWDSCVEQGGDDLVNKDGISKSRGFFLKEVGKEGMVCTALVSQEKVCMEPVLMLKTLPRILSRLLCKH